MNRGAVALAVRLALALGCEVRTRSIFARKNYFYPDLPKGYQISQYDQPLAVRGRLGIEGGGEPRPVGITRVHMEEDAGKLIHEGPLAVLDASLVDFNRAGTPLVEIVGEPELRSPEEAYEYLTRLKSILTYTDVCDGNMEEGSLRCDANVSLREKGTMAFARVG
jgi:aspartyl-tRNA(Asn)/glutamyl-tRNA(Gln) amidotransferase subunit B